LDAIQRALDTNFFGAYRLTIALLPLLRESEHARVVNASTLPDDGPTGASSATASPSLSSRRSGLALKACT
jgi:NAD(P)-dependent dehydrogenase (short-subunit alcohol dehydrogenase family)